MTGKQAARLRRRKKITQRDFWERIGITQSGGSRYETDRALPKPISILLDLTYGPHPEAVLRRLAGVRP